MWRKLSVYFAVAASCFVLTSCGQEEEAMAENMSQRFYLRNDGADMPVTVEGNSASKVFLVILHGGPGGSAMRHYHQVPEVTDALEQDYALVYWEQRSSGMSSGNASQESITLDQFSDDLDKLLVLLRHKYGSDIKLFLLGQSFGGILGSYYLTQGFADDGDIAGWISLGGATGFKDYTGLVKRYGNDFLSQNDNPEFDELRTKFAELDSNDQSIESITDANEFAKELQEKVRDLGLAEPRQVEGITSAFFFGDFNPLVAILNKDNVNETLATRMKDLSLAEDMKRATPPALYMYGEFDFIVPPTIGKLAFDAYGNSDKQFLIFERGTHNLLATHPEKSVAVISDFIEAYR